MVLSTDMARHAEINSDIEALPSVLDQLEGNGEAHSSLQTGELQKLRSLMMQGVLHAADLYAPTLFFIDSSRWVSYLISEFKNQIALEKSYSLPPSYFLVPTDFADQGRKEHAFASRMVRPFYGALRRFMPQLHPCLDMIDHNLIFWQQVEAGVQLECLPLEQQHEITLRWNELPIMLEPSTQPMVPFELEPPPQLFLNDGEPPGAAVANAEDAKAFILQARHSRNLPEIDEIDLP